MLLDKLRELNADPDDIDNQILANAFHKAGYHGRTAVAKKLVDWLVANPKNRGLLDAQGPYNGYTPLHDAIWHCHYGAIEEFLKKANRELKTHTGHTALALADLYCKRCPKVVDLIKNKKEDEMHAAGQE